MYKVLRQKVCVFTLSPTNKLPKHVKIKKGRNEKKQSDFVTLQLRTREVQCNRYGTIHMNTERKERMKNIKINISDVTTKKKRKRA